VDVMTVPGVIGIADKMGLMMVQGSVEKLPFFLPSWTGVYTVNILLCVYIAVVGIGFGGWASVTNFIKQVETFGVFAKCYQCPKTKPS
jgi:auxin influx carrier (AUX1 LAX family)